MSFIQVSVMRARGLKFPVVADSDAPTQQQLFHHKDEQNRKGFVKLISVLLIADPSHPIYLPGQRIADRIYLVLVSPDIYNQHGNGWFALGETRVYYSISMFGSRRAMLARVDGYHRGAQFEAALSDWPKRIE